MSRLSSATFFLAAALLVTATGSAHAQANVENVNINTADGVKLKGHFFPAAGKCQATVIMLHPVGEGKDMKVPEWKSLAEALQKNGCSVLMFDFRGHGDSKEIASPKDFWNKTVNFQNVRTKNKEEIDVKDYIKQGAAYLPVLCNDIAAARAFLERRNDASKDCNTSSIIVIGAETGGTLGAIWINSEWNRYKYTPPSPPVVTGGYTKTPEGNDIIGAVFLSISPKLDKQRSVPIVKMLNTACKEKGTAAWFLAGTDDAKFAKDLESKLKVKGSKRHDFIGAADFNVNLSGMKLLTKGVKAGKDGLESSIVEYISGVVDDRKSEWTEREFDKSFYSWRLPTGQMVPAKRKGEKTLVFDEYYKFSQ